MNTYEIVNRIQKTVEYLHDRNHAVERIEISKHWYETLKLESEDGAVKDKLLGYPLVKNVELFDYIVVTLN